MPIIPLVLDQHGEEAAILWLRRDRAVSEPHYSLDDLAKLDGQLEAHLDGLRIAEADTHDTAWEVCQRELAWGEAGEVFPAAILAFEGGNPARLGLVLEAASESYERSRCLVSALGWLNKDRAIDHAKQLLGSKDVNQRRYGLAASAAHRFDPGSALDCCIMEDDVLLRARAVRAVGELGRADLLGAVACLLQDGDENVVRAAAWTASRLAKDPVALDCLQRLAQQARTDCPRALQMVVRCLDIGACRSWIELLDATTETARSAVIAAGALGNPAMVPWILDRMDVSRLARVAGEAFSMVTGVDIAYQDLEGEWPTGFHAGPTEDPEDENVAMDTDENLPWPNRQSLGAWWVKHRDQFQPGTRYLCGRPVEEKWCEEILRTGYQRQRAAAALELALRRPGQPLFEVRAPGFRQHKLLGVK